MGNHTSLRKIFVVGLVTIVLAASLAYADPPPEEVWNVVYSDMGSADFAYDVTVDDAGFVYVAGFSIRGQPTCYRTMKYTPSGNAEWNKTYSWGDEINRALGVDVDTAGFVYVAGSRSTNRYGSPISGDYQLIKYDPDSGNVIWVRIYDQDQNDVATGVAVDEAGFIYITGYSGPQEIPDHGPPEYGPYDFCTVKYDTDGERLWVREHNSGWDDRAFGVAVDDDGNIYVAGSQYRSATGYDYLIIKYDPDGNEIWKRSFYTWYDDWAYGIAVSKDGYIYATGWSGSEEDGYDYLTVKIDSAGNWVWNETYDKNVKEKAHSIAVDESGYIYVTGWTLCENEYDDRDYGFLTVKYDQDGNVRWEKVFDAENSGDLAYGIAVDKEGYVYVTGLSFGMRTIKYRQVLGIEEEIPVRVDPTLSLDPAPGGSITIRYQLTLPSRVNLSVYDASGRRAAILVDAVKQPGEYEVSWSPHQAGVYFIRFASKNHIAVKKFVACKN